MKIRFGPTATEEICVMLEASAETNQIAKSILDKSKGCIFELTKEEADYLLSNIYGDVERVHEGCGASVARAFENAGDKLAKAMTAYGNN